MVSFFTPFTNRIGIHFPGFKTPNTPRVEPSYPHYIGKIALPEGLEPPQFSIKGKTTIGLWSGSDYKVQHLVAEEELTALYPVPIDAIPCKKRLCGRVAPYTHPGKFFLSLSITFPSNNHHQPSLIKYNYRNSWYQRRFNSGVATLDFHCFAQNPGLLSLDCRVYTPNENGHSVMFPVSIQPRVVMVPCSRILDTTEEFRQWMYDYRVACVAAGKPIETDIDCP